MRKTDSKNTTVAINENSVVLPKTNATGEDLAKIETRLDNIFSTARKSTVDVAECIATLNFTKAYVLKGYASIEEYCETEYSIKKTQVNLALRIVSKYCTEDNKRLGDFSIEDKFKDYGADKLDIIQKIDNFSIDNFDALVESLEITPKTTLADLKSIYRKSKGIEEKAPEQKNIAPDTPENDTVTSTLKKANDKKTAQLDDIKSLLVELYKVALDEDIPDADFRETAKNTLHKIENIYK